MGGEGQQWAALYISLFPPKPGSVRVRFGQAYGDFKQAKAPR